MNHLVADVPQPPPIVKIEYIDVEVPVTVIEYVDCSSGGGSGSGGEPEPTQPPVLQAQEKQSLI